MRFPRESLPHALSLSRPVHFAHPFPKGGFITLLKVRAIQMLSYNIAGVRDPVRSPDLC